MPVCASASSGAAAGGGCRRLGRRVAAALLALALGAPLAAPADQEHAVVLLYHRVGEDRYPSTNVTEAQFRDHLEHLAAEGYHVAPLGELVRRLRAGESVPDGSVAITFDDAYASVGEVAHPLLAERDWPYTVFVSTGYIDGDYRGYLGWADMRRLARYGVRFGNHSRDHGHLFAPREGEEASAWRERVRADLEAARERLRAELDDAVHRNPALLAYPYGEYGAELAELAAELEFVAFGQHSGVIGRHSDWQALPRFAMNERYAELEGFRDKVAARPMPVLASEPADPVRSDDAPPALTLEIGATESALDRLSCFYGDEVLTPERLDGQRVRVQGEAPLPRGRSRYNCTLPDGEGGHYWHSQLWIHGAAPGEAD